MTKKVRKIEALIKAALSRASKANARELFAIIQFAEKYGLLHKEPQSIKIEFVEPPRWDGDDHKK